MNEISRITDQLQRTVEGNAWHGPAVLEVLQEVTTEQALKKPIAAAHNIWEIVLHITAWHLAVTQRLEGYQVELSKEEDWPPINNNGVKNSWNSAVNLLTESYKNLLNKVSSLSDSDLNRTVPGRDHSVYFLLHGIIQHDLYHAGQIAILRKS
jgi:uncharacterized damage-inducible protein DinB